MNFFTYPLETRHRLVAAEVALIVVTLTIACFIVWDLYRNSLALGIGALCSVSGFGLFMLSLWAHLRRLEESKAALAVQNSELQSSRVVLERQTVELGQTADALKKNEGRFRDFALTASDWFWETDENHRFVYISENVPVFGMGGDKYVGTTRMENAADFTSEPEKWLAHITILDRHEPFRDFVYVRKGGLGDPQTASVSGKPLFAPSGRFLGYRGTARDVTDKIAAEHKLLAAKAAAEAANLAKSEFLANMSHELRTPLNAILGFSEVIKDEIFGPSAVLRYVEYADDIHNSGKHLLNVINDILDLARIDAGKFELNEESEIDAQRIIDVCLALVKGTADAATIQITTAIQDHIPTLVGDPTRITQILLNLLSNAVKFTAPGGSVAVSLRRAVGSGDVVFEVRDTGPGMDPAELKIAMEPFGQNETSDTRRHHGTGLGLPLARHLAELHGGSLHISSAKRHGTTVALILPADRALTDGTRPAEGAPSLAAADPILQAGRSSISR